MTKLSQEQLDSLARFAGLTLNIDQQAWIDERGGVFCSERFWQPLTDWNCLKLVLEALCKKVVVDPSVPLRIYLSAGGGASLLCNPRERRGVGRNTYSDGDTLAEAVAAAALACIEGEADG